MNTLPLKGATLRTEKLSALRFTRLLMGLAVRVEIARAGYEIIPIEGYRVDSSFVDRSFHERSLSFRRAFNFRDLVERACTDSLDARCFFYRMPSGSMRPVRSSFEHVYSFRSSAGRTPISGTARYNEILRVTRIWPPACPSTPKT